MRLVLQRVLACPVVETELELFARAIVGAAAVLLGLFGLAELGRERLAARPRPIVRHTGPLAAVNFVGIGGFVLLGAWTAWSKDGTLAIRGRPGAMLEAFGILVLAGGGALAMWGIRSIGHHLASAAEVRPDTQVVTRGAYGLVRHPLYLSILLLWAGGALALASWILALGCALLVPAVVERCRLEERLLVSYVGESYLAYAARVPMLVPRLARSRRRSERSP